MLTEEETRTPHGGTRLRMVPVEQFDPELRELVAADDRTPLELGLLRVHAHRPSHAKAIVGLHAALWTDRLLPDRLLELVRLRIAFFNQCRTCMAIRYPGAVADGLTEALVCSLEKPHEASDLSAAEQAAIRYGELLATDHLAIDESGLRRPPQAFHRGGDRGARHLLRVLRRLRQAGSDLEHDRGAPEALPRGPDRHPLGRRGDHRSLTPPVSTKLNPDPCSPSRSSCSTHWSAPTRPRTSPTGTAPWPILPCRAVCASSCTSSPSSPSSATAATRAGGAPLARSPDGSAGRQSRGCQRRGSRSGSRPRGATGARGRRHHRDRHLRRYRHGPLPARKTRGSRRDRRADRAAWPPRRRYPDRRSRRDGGRGGDRRRRGGARSAGHRGRERRDRDVRRGRHDV